MNTNRAVFFLIGGRLPFPTLAVSDFECDRRGYRVWQYRLWSFQKLESCLAKNHHAQRKVLNFANWCSGGSVKKCQNLTVKVNFLCQKPPKNTNIGAHLL